MSGFGGIFGALGSPWGASKQAEESPFMRMYREQMETNMRIVDIQDRCPWNPPRKLTPQEVAEKELLDYLGPLPDIVLVG